MNLKNRDIRVYRMTDYKIKWRIENKDKIKESNKKYYEKNKDTLTEKMKEYQLNHKEKVALAKRKYREKMQNIS